MSEAKELWSSGGIGEKPSLRCDLGHVTSLLPPVL